MRKEIEYYLSAYAIFLHNRKTKTEKEDFVMKNVGLFSNCGYQVNVESSSKDQNKKNIVIGNLKEANKVILASYDLVNRTIIPGFRYYPLDLDKSKSYEIVNMMVSLIIILISIIIPPILFGLISDKSLVIKILFIVLSIAFLLIVYNWIFSIPKNNLAQDYSLSLIYALADNNRDEKVCYVLCENSRLNYFGMRDFLNNHEDELHNKQIIVLSEFVNDKEIYLIGNNANSKESMIICVKDNKKHNILKYTNNGWLITGCNKIGDDLVVINHRNNKTKPISVESFANIYITIEKIIKRK